MRLRSFCGFCGGPLGPPDDNLQPCAACGESHYHDAKPCSAVLVLDDAGRVLLARRALDPGRGQWDTPGGFCAPDETPEDCAIRELREETGCEIELTGFLGHIVDVYGEDGDHTLNALYTARIVRGVPRPADDVDELRWFALDALPLLSELAFANTAECLRRLVER
jgi:ADP-ribose pyrophosphatase YjhB (NUDIX family)